MNNRNVTIRDYLYEAPGPKTKRYITIGTVLSLICVAWLIYIIIRLFYENGQLDAKYWSIFTRATTWRFFGKGLLGTLEVSLAAMLVTFSLGMIMMIGRINRNKVISTIATVFIELSRGIPTLLFIYFFFLAVPQFGLKLPAFWKITLPVAISAAGVTAETLRSGVNAVPKGQREAAISLGMRDHTVFLKIIFPQAFRIVIPGLISELVIVLKDTTFAYVVSYADLMQNARVMISNYDALLSVYLVVAVIYILINYGLNKLSVYLANRRKRLQAG